MLEIVSSDFLFHRFPDMPEGDLTKTRASMVCEPTLAYCAEQIDLGAISFGKGGGRYRRTYQKFRCFRRHGGSDRSNLPGRWFY